MITQCVSGRRRTGRLLRTMTGHEGGYVSSVSWSADSSKIVSGGYGDEYGAHLGGVVQVVCCTR